MTQELWNRMDAYIDEKLVGEAAELEGALRRCAEAGLPPIQVSPAQGKLLNLLVRAQQARTVLEVGTLGGYSALWMALALPLDGKLITLELSPLHAKVARANIAAAGLADAVEVRVGPASETLRALEAEGLPPFDLIFIDADKQGYPDYFAQALRLSRRGTLLVFDNVVRGGRVLEGAQDAGTRGIQLLYERLAAEPRVSATAIQTVGVKGYDGFAVALVTR